MSISSPVVKIGLSNSDGSPVDFTTLMPNLSQKALALGAEYFDVNASPRVFYVINKLFTGFDPLAQGGGGGGGGGSGTAPAPQKITTNRALLPGDSSGVLSTDPGDATNYAITIPQGLGANFGSVTMVQRGAGTISIAGSVGVTIANNVTGSTTGPGSAISVVRTDPNTESYAVFLPTIVPVKATTTDAQTGTDDAKFMTPSKTAAAIAALGFSYVYVGLSTGLAAAVTTPADGMVAKLTDAAFGGAGGTSGYGVDWVYVGSKSNWFPRASIKIATVLSAGGIAGTANATLQSLGVFTLPAICSKSGMRIKFDGIFGKTGTAATMTFNLKLGGQNALVPSTPSLSATQLHGYFQGDYIFDSGTSMHEESNNGVANQTTVPTLILGLTANAALVIAPFFTPGSTDTPVLYALNIEILPFGGV